MEKTEVISNEALVNDVVMGLHQSFGETNSYRGRYIAYFGVNSDCEIWNNTGKKGAFTDKEGALVTYNATTDNQYMNTDNNVWAKLYEAIERANSAITGMDEYSDMSSTNMRQFYGELLTLRAFIYFDLIKAFGDVPARFEPNTTETIDLPKTDRMVIMRRLLDDLLTAQDYVGWPNENSFTKSTDYARGLHYLRLVTHNIRMESVTIQRMQQKDRNSIQLQKTNVWTSSAKGITH